MAEGGDNRDARVVSFRWVGSDEPLLDREVRVEEPPRVVAVGPDAADLGRQVEEQLGVKDLIELVSPGRTLRQLQEDVEVSDTFKNRQALARGYVTAGMHQEAIAEYQRCPGFFARQRRTVRRNCGVSAFSGSGSHRMISAIRPALLSAWNTWRPAAIS